MLNPQTNVSCATLCLDESHGIHGSLVFLENESQVREAARLRSQIPDLEAVAVFPLVMEQARDLEIPVRPLDHFGNTAELEWLCPVIIERFEELACIFDTNWEKLTTGIPSAGCVSFRSFFHTIKGFFDSLVKRGLPVIRAMEVLRPRQVLSFSNTYSVAGFNLLDKPPSGLTTALVPFCAAQVGVKVTRLTEGSHTENLVLFPVASRSRIPLVTALALLEKVQHSPTWASSNKEHRKTLLCYTEMLDSLNYECGQKWVQSGYRIEAFLPKLQGYGIPLEILLQCCQSIAHAAADTFKAEQCVARLMLIENFDAGALLSSYIDALLRCKIKDLLALSHAVKPYLRSFPHGVLLGGGMSNEAFVVTRAARQEGMPTLEHFNIENVQMLGGE